MSLGKILLVEDDLLSAKVLQHSVERLGYQVVGNVQNGREAIPLFTSKEPDVVLLDFMIEGGIDGGDLARELNKIKKTPVVFITSSEDEKSLNKILASKPDGYIQKPIEPRELKAVLEMVFYKHAKEKELESLNQGLDKKVKERTRELDIAVEALSKEIMEKEKIHRQLEKALVAEKQFGEMKSRIVSNLSHEFKTPLSSIRSSAQLLDRIITKGKVDEKSLKHTERIEKGVDILTDLLTRILLVEKDQEKVYSAKLVEFDFRTFYEGLQQEVNGGMAEGIRVEWKNSVKQSLLFSDPKLLRLITTNVISNACKYSHPGGKISIRFSLEGETLHFSVQDAGIGMSEEDLDQVYNRFYRGHNVESIEGTGIGMSIMKRCLDALKGEVKIASQVNEGTRVDISVPIVVRS